jgi:hypothetical protein
MDKVQKAAFTDYNASSSEPFGLYLLILADTVKILTQLRNLSLLKLSSNEIFSYYKVSVMFTISLKLLHIKFEFS